ncbi:hypothetical protein [Lacinutrix sp. MEBiC02595]
MRIILIGILISFFSCSPNNKEIPIIKRERIKKYSSKLIDNKIEKDTLINEYEIGNESDGKQSYFLGIKGYNNQDTTWTESNYSKKIDENKTFLLNSENEIQIVTIKEKDTFFVYAGNDLDKPTSYQLNDNKGIKEEVDLTLGIKKKYKDREFDKNENLIFYNLYQTYFPTEFDKKYLSSGDKLKKESEYLENTIIEIEYEYYK